MCAYSSVSLTGWELLSGREFDLCIWELSRYQKAGSWASYISELPYPLVHDGEPWNKRKDIRKEIRCPYFLFARSPHGWGLMPPPNVSKGPILQVLSDNSSSAVTALTCKRSLYKESPPYYPNVNVPSLCWCDSHQYTMSSSTRSINIPANQQYLKLPVIEDTEIT